MVAFAVAIALLVMSGAYLLWPLLVTGGALLYLRLSGRVKRRRPQP